MKCKNCGKGFAATTVVQKYCCSKCGREYRKIHDINSEYPSIEFNCTMCGKRVVTEGSVKDKRTRFCSHSCEKKFWKHPFWENTTVNTNFHSVEEYASWERRTNED